MALDGTYKVVTSTPLGPKDDLLIVKTEGTILTGTFADSTISDGTINGDEFSFSAQVKGPIGKIDAVISGKVVEGGIITGTSKTKFGNFSIQGAKE